MGEEEGEVQERVDSRATKVQRFSRGAGGVLAGARAHSNKSRANARATLSTRGLYLKPPAGGRQAMLPRRSASQAIEKQAKDIPPPRDIPTGPARLWLYNDTLSGHTPKRAQHVTCQGLSRSVGDTEHVRCLDGHPTRCSPALGNCFF